MVHTHKYSYGKLPELLLYQVKGSVIITIIADHQDESYDILCNIVKNPEQFKLFDSETIDKME